MLLRLLIALFIFGAVGRSEAQAPEPAVAPLPLNDGSISTTPGTPIGGGEATGVPGVGLATDLETEENGLQGPGGLANGVGAEGTLAPSTSGANNDIVDTQPGEATDGGIPLPLGAPAEGATAN